MKLLPGLPSLRHPAIFPLILACLTKARDRNGARICHFSVQSNHIHVLVEAANEVRVARGMQGLAVRIAKQLNKAIGRRGRVFADRYHDRMIRTPRQARSTLRYVLNNALHHGFAHFVAGRPAADPCSSAAWFDGWSEPPRPEGEPRPPVPPVLPPRTWLLTIGWRRHGLIGITEVPGPRHPRLARDPT